MSTMYETLNTIYAHAYEHMSAEDLCKVGMSLHDEAISMGRDMSTLLEGVACLISSDNQIRESGSGPSSGNFQTPSSIFQILCLAASKFDLLAAMVEIGSDASQQAEQRRKISGGEA